MTIFRLLLLMLVSCLLYIGIYMFVVEKPITIGIKQDYFARKTTYLATLGSPKIVLLAGSNGRFSHRCETLTEETGIPCANMSIVAGMSLEYQFNNIKPYLHEGDLVYLPLEYAQYRRSKLQVMAGEDAPYIVAYDRDYLARLPPEHLLNTLFYADLKFYISAVGEMLLQRFKPSKRYSVDDLTEQGDESGHTVAKGAIYRAHLDKFAWKPPKTEDFLADSSGAQSIADFMHWSMEKGIRVVGGLPTTFDDVPVPQELLQSLCTFYRGNGQDIVMLGNLSQYPRSHFYDSPNHLTEEYQIQHSKLLAPVLQRAMTDSLSSGDRRCSLN